MQAAAWSVHKFGGTSLKNSERNQRVVELLLQGPHTPTAVVVSSMAGVTDALLELVALAEQRQPYKDQLQALHKRQYDTAAALLTGEHLDAYVEQLDQGTQDIEQMLRAIWLLGHAAEVASDWLVGYGELWSARLITAILTGAGHSATWLDAREVLRVSHNESTTLVDWETSQGLLDTWRQKNPANWLIITGFVASLPTGTPTTLRRNGSDFSASIFAALLKAKALTIWTDVDGVFSADPRRVPEAELLPHLSWQEATELAYFGASVLHPHAMAPAIAHNIPITIRNSFRPDVEGTQITAPDARPDTIPGAPMVKGFSTIDAMSLINVEGAGMIGVPGVAHRLFGALREVGVSVVMISQASSEHSICFAVPEAQAETAIQTVRDAFYREITEGQIHTIDAVGPCSILAAVGDAMVETPGVAAQFFNALANAGVNVRAIAQGSSERNISAVIDQADSTRALRAVHAGFFLSQQTLSVGLVGPGLIGSALLDQIHAQADILRDRFQIDLRVRGIINSSKMLLAEQAIPLNEWQAQFESCTEAADLERFAAHIQAEHLPHCAIIDCTASGKAAEWVPTWLGQRLHVLTPNKKAFSSALSTYKTLHKVARENRVHAFYEATVGAGLPVITTLRDLRQTGDTILHIEGIFSGTLSYLFNTLTPEMPFSSLVRQAKEQGFTEPDPRDDLSGTDVARKLVILARETGLSLELEDIEVESLVPAALVDVSSVESFLDQLADHDTAMREKLEAATAAGQVLRYVGSIDATAGAANAKARVSLAAYDLAHPFAGLRGSDNIIAFRTRRYDAQPLLVQGPGAGPEVTAGGVFADLLRLAAHLGAPSA